ncbi:MAG: preprotein translocase subunit YajC [Kiritimatiellae bacterium]|nr:preprotein translocase subunit YajC [Kiritimatiellia bacterium]
MTLAKSIPMFVVLGQAGAEGSPGGMFTFVMLGIMVALFYFMLIRPQQRKEKERRALIESVKTGDRVVFGGGLLGTITNVKDKAFVVRVADNVKIEVLRSSVTRVIGKDEKPE